MVEGRNKDEELPEGKQQLRKFSDRQTECHTDHSENPPPPTMRVNGNSQNRGSLGGGWGWSREKEAAGR